MAHVEVIALTEFRLWYDRLDESDVIAVTRSVDLLEGKGVLLGHPHTSAIMGASFALRELRVQSGGRPIRVFYAFDPLRQAVLLLGGDKTGDGQFYERMVPLCTRLWNEYLADMAKEGEP